MKFGVLLSGGKDSVYSAYLASRSHELVCAITIVSENKDSYMFHTPNIDKVGLQCQAMGIPLIIVKTKGAKEEELVDLKNAISEAVEKYKIECVVTGAVKSQYQASRVQKICHDLDLYSLNPLWQKDEFELLNDLISDNFEVVIASIAAYGLDKNWIGKVLDNDMFSKLKNLNNKIGLNVAFEGGEAETYVVDCPLFSKKISINDFSVDMEDENTGRMTILDASLDEKEVKEVKDKEKKTFDKKITVVSCAQEGFESEFVKPLIDVANECGFGCNVIKVGDKIVDEKVIISGTTLKDVKYVKNKINIAGKKVFGICAGFHLILREMGVELEDVLEIGPKRLIGDWKDLNDKEAYFLHQLGVEKLDNRFEVLLKTDLGVAAFKVKDKEIYGTQFHPEVSQRDLLKWFIYE